jgi:hypothetical protein
VVDFVYKWAPDGNSSERNFKFQAEFFDREEKGEAEFTEGTNSAEANYDGEQDGFYASAVYQFMPKWRAGVQYSEVSADNTITNFVNNGVDEDEFGEESGLGPADHDPSELSLMVDYSNSEFSRLRFQVSQMELQKGVDENVYTVQYIMSLGAHGAHRF